MAVYVTLTDDYDEIVSQLQHKAHAKGAIIFVSDAIADDIEAKGKGVREAGRPEGVKVTKRGKVVSDAGEGS